MLNKLERWEEALFEIWDLLILVRERGGRARANQLAQQALDLAAAAAAPLTATNVAGVAPARTHERHT